jgi:hypothetical protein
MVSTTLRQLISERDKLQAEIEALRHKVEGLEMAIAPLFSVMPIGGAAHPRQRDQSEIAAHGSAGRSSPSAQQPGFAERPPLKNHSPASALRSWHGVTSGRRRPARCR